MAAPKSQKERSRRRLMYLELGYPLSTGEVLDKPLGKSVGKRDIASREDMEHIIERLEVEQSQGVNRGAGIRRDKKRRKE